ncbi:hypothetical protein CPL00172_CDS0022 [Escherichia phage BubbaBully]
MKNNKPQAAQAFEPPALILSKYLIQMRRIVIQISCDLQVEGLERSLLPFEMALQRMCNPNEHQMLFR